MTCVFRVVTKGEMSLIHERLERTRRQGLREGDFLKVARTDLEEEEKARECWRREVEQGRQPRSCSRSRSRSRPPNSPEKLSYSKALDKVGHSYHINHTLLVCNNKISSVNSGNIP